MDEKGLNLTFWKMEEVNIKVRKIPLTPPSFLGNIVTM